MKNIHRVSLFTLLGLVVSIIPLHVTFADVLQPDYSVPQLLGPIYPPADGSCANNEMCSPVYKLIGTVTNATHVHIYAEKYYTGPLAGAAPRLTVRECDDKAMTQNCTDVLKSIFLVFGYPYEGIFGGWTILNGNTTFTFSPDKYYTFAFWNEYIPYNGAVYANVYGDAEGHPYIDVDGVSIVQQLPPSIANLAQYQEDGVIPISQGSGFIGNSMILKADVSDHDSAAAVLEVEVKPVDQAFDGTNTTFSATTTSAVVPLATTTVSVTVDHLITPQGNVPADGIQKPFHWRARVVDAEGNTSDWVIFGSTASSTDFTATYTLGQAAADQAIQMIHQNYLWGGKGWDVYDKRFVDQSEVVTNYTYWNSNGKIAQGNGLDCSGLVAWSYDHSFNPDNFFNHNFIGEPNANLQYYDNMQSTSTSDVGLMPGDVAFFGTGAGGTMSHVAMYVGNHGDYDVVEARNKILGIATTTTTALERRGGLVAFGHPKNFAAARVSASTASPVSLSVTDPTGTTVNTQTIIPSDEEYIREAGDLTYMTYGIDAAGYPEDIVYSPHLQPGTYHIIVSPLPNTTLDQTYSLTFNSGNVTLPLAVNVPLRNIPSTGYGIVVGNNGAATLDTTPPEAHIGFSTTTQHIMIAGSDDLSPISIATTSTSAVISDAAGNTLNLNIAQNITQSNYASLVIPSFIYSSGTTTSATTSLRYFWLTDKSGKYILLISAIKTPADRIVSLYVPLLNKTYVFASTSSDDTVDLSTQTALLLLRKKLSTYTGMVIPHISTKQGTMVIEY